MTRAKPISRAALTLGSAVAIGGLVAAAPAHAAMSTGPCSGKSMSGQKSSDQGMSGKGQSGQGMASSSMTDGGKSQGSGMSNGMGHKTGPCSAKK